MHCECVALASKVDCLVAMAYNKGSRKVYKGHKFVSGVQTTKKAKNRDSEKKIHQFLNRVNLQLLGNYTRASLVN